MADGKSNIQELPPPYHVGPPISTPSDVKKDEAGAQQVPGYPTGMGPTQNLSQPGYPAHVAYNPQQGYPLQPYSHNNVVVIGQPVPAPVMTTSAVQPTQRKAKDFLIFSVILIILCFLQGNIPNVMFTLPALICSLAAQDYNRSGNYTGAKHCGYMALGCNIAVTVWYVIEIITLVIVLAVILSADTYTSSSSGTGYSYSRCSGYNYNNYNC